MATTFKTFLNDDVVSTRSLLHEAIPITGTIASGTYVDTTAEHPGNENNIKDYPHGMFQSVYDYPYLSSSANHIFDLTVGHASQSHADSTWAGSTDTLTKTKKKNIYNQMAQVLMGHDATGSIMQFDADGDLIAGGVKHKNCFFLNFARLLAKDEIKKGSFSIAVSTANYNDVSFWDASKIVTITDDGAENDYRVNSPAGEYGILKASSGGAVAAAATTASVGLIYYQAGIVVLSSSIFAQYNVDAAPQSTSPGSSSVVSHNQGVLSTTGSGMTTGDWGVYGDPSDIVSCTDVHELFEDHPISGACNEFRRRIQSVEFNNTTELNSTVYFCRVNHNDFNYSANPTYLSGSKIRVKRSTVDAPVSYFTTIGLYSSDNELLAVAKLSEPLRKDPTNEMILRVRLDY